LYLSFYSLRRKSSVVELIVPPLLKFSYYFRASQRITKIRYEKKN